MFTPVRCGLQTKQWAVILVTWRNWCFTFLVRNLVILIILCNYYDKDNFYCIWRILCNCMNWVPLVVWTTQDTIWCWFALIDFQTSLADFLVSWNYWLTLMICIYLSPLLFLSNFHFNWFHHLFPPLERLNLNPTNMETNKKNLKSSNRNSKSLFLLNSIIFCFRGYEIRTWAGSIIYFPTISNHLLPLHLIPELCYQNSRWWKTLEKMFSDRNQAWLCHFLRELVR